MDAQPEMRFPVMGLGLICLLAGLWAGLLRLGWGIPRLQPTLSGLHGPLMICGFLGTLIGLERALALRKRWAYVVPLLTGVGGLIMIVGVSGLPGPVLMTLGSLGLVMILVLIFRLQPALHTATVGVGALIWFSGNLLWLAGASFFPASQPERPAVTWLEGQGFQLAGWSMSSVVLWWLGFLVLTIAGERLELSRLRRLSAGSRIEFLAAAGFLLAGLFLTLVWLDAGVRLAGVGMAALALWLLVFDIARRTVRAGGLTRFIAVSLLSGHVWLGLGGLLAIRFGPVTSGPQHDAFLHAVFLGFVFAMIFGHAPIIFPAVLGRAMTFRPTFYLHLGLLHLSLLLRVTGDLAGWPGPRRWGGLLNVLTLLLFLGNTVNAVRQGRRETGSSSSRAEVGQTLLGRQERS